MIVGFDSAWVQLLNNEGGFSNRPNDPGGATMWGVTEKVARAEGWQGRMQDLPVDFAKALAKRRYWDPYQCDQMPADVAFHVFDAAYNGGHPAVWLQQCLGLAPDGVIGPVTIGALRSANLERIKRLFGAYRQIYLTGLPQEEWIEDGRGWMVRLAKNQLAT